MRAALLQQTVLPCQDLKNLSQALYLASSALEMGAEILVYPELFLSGFCYEPIDRFWERGTRAFEELDPFRALAKDSDCLIIGSVRGGRSNLGFCLDRTGLKLTLVANRLLRVPPSPHIRAVQVAHGFDAADAKGVNEAQLRDKMEANRRELNNRLPGYCAISKIELYPNEFEKTPTRKIKRFLYTIPENVS